MNDERPDIDVAVFTYGGKGKKLPPEQQHLDGTSRVLILVDGKVLTMLGDEEAVELAHRLVDAAQGCNPTRIGDQEPVT